MGDCDREPDNPPSVELAFPDPSSPEVRGGELSSICSFGVMPRLMTGILRQILTQHFVDAQNIHNSVVRGWLEKYGVWGEGPTAGISIENITRWKPEQVEKRPGIVLKGEDWKWSRVGIGDQAGQDWRSGKEFYAGLWQGAHTIFVVGAEDAETELLAAEVARLLLWFGPAIADNFDLHRFVLVSLGAIHTLKESTENYVVPITVAYVKEESWVLQEEAPRLKRISFTAEALLDRLDD